MKKKLDCTIHVHIVGVIDIKFKFETSDDLKLLQTITDKITKDIIAPNYPVKK